MNLAAERDKALGNAIYAELRKGLCEKDELVEEFRLNERIVRDIISEIAKRRAIITPDKGYKAPQFTPEDGLEVIHELRDLESRAAKILERRQPLWDYIADYQKKLGVKTLSDFELALKLQSQK